jgi:ATP-dependent helicase/DNAse subunit B
VLGARVVRFAWLFEQIAERCADGDDPPRRRASDLQRELIVGAAVRGAHLESLAESAARPGFTRAATRLVGELERSLVTPARFGRALADWAGDGPRAGFAREVAAIYRGYRAGMDAAGVASEELAAWRAADALRRHPDRWGRTPVFVYGFDDFTEVELDAIETLATRAEAEVVVSLPYERGRAAFKALSTVFQRLAERAGDHVELDAIDTHYAPESRDALHHLERNLFEPTGDRVDARGAVRMLVAGGERAEVELVAAEVLKLLRDGTEPGQVAVVFRDPAAYGSVVEQVFDAYGIPFSIDRRVPLAHTTLGRALLALLRCACCEGTADDLLAYLRAPGLLARPELADRLEAEIRQGGVRDADGARKLWERDERWSLDEIDRLRNAAERGPAALLAELDKRLEALWVRPYRRQAHVFKGAESDDPRVWNEAHSAIAGLRTAVESGAVRSLDATGIHDALAELPVRMGDDPRPERVQVASPEQVRARRFHAVIVAGLQEGEMPRGAASEPFLSDDDRRSLAVATGLRLPVRDDQLERERYLFYVCASRAERVLMLSTRVSDEEGNPQVGSFFLQDVADLFEPIKRRERLLGDVAWPLDDAPTREEWERARASLMAKTAPETPGGLADPAVLHSLADRELSTSALEAYSDCPVKWLVERILRPDQLEPDPEYMVRGNYAHAVLELTYRRLREETGDSAPNPGNLPTAERIMREALLEQQSEFQLSPQETRVRAAVRRLEFDLIRHLHREAESGSRFKPTELELPFGGGFGGLPPLELNGVTIQGKIDRVDTLGGRAVVRDYKSGSKTWPVARWKEDRRLQVALYMIAVRDLMGLEPVGGFYVPLSGKDPRPRGVVESGWQDDVGGAIVDNDVQERAVIDELLDSAREQVSALADEMRSGKLEPCPETCSFRGKCSYPAICRSEQ